jgi:hypothetical protein
MSTYEEGLNGTPGLVNITNTTCFPAPVTLTGTISSSGVDVTGTGTLFLSEIALPQQDGKLLNYKYIYDESSGEIREIDYVISDTALRLKVSFSSDLSGADLTCPDYRSAYRELTIVSAFGVAVGCVNQPIANIVPNIPFRYRWMGGLKPISVLPDGVPVVVLTLI